MRIGLCQTPKTVRPMCTLPSWPGGLRVTQLAYRYSLNDSTQDLPAHRRGTVNLPMLRLLLEWAGSRDFTVQTFRDYCNELWYLIIIIIIHYRPTIIGLHIHWRRLVKNMGGTNILGEMAIIVCLPDSLDLTRCLSILFWISACE